MISESLSASGRCCSVAGTVSASRWIFVTYSPVYSGEPASTSVCSSLGHLLRVWEELPIAVRLLMQVSSHFRGPSSPGFNSWTPLKKLISCHVIPVCWESQGRIASLFKFGVRSWVVRLLYAIFVCIHICIFLWLWDCFTLFFWSPMNVPVVLNPYQSVMPGLSLHFQFLFLLKIYSHIGLVCTRLAFNRHLAGAWQLMWVRMSIMESLANVVSLHNQIGMCGAGCKLFRPAASHVKQSVFECPGEGFIPAFCVLMAAFEIQS